MRRDISRIPNKKAAGFTLIEVLVDISIFSIVSLAVISSYVSSFKAIDYSKAKLAAVALANEKMEDLRNMSYIALATEHGAIYPPGSIKDEESVYREGIKLMVITNIAFVDDPYDGNSAGTIEGKPKDLFPYDYKKAEITVYKVGGRGILTKITSNFASSAAETSTDSGVAGICVVDSASNPVNEATVTISNSSLSPVVNISTTTGEDGCISVPSLPPDNKNNYHIVVSKSGYSTDMTYPRTAQNPNSLQPDIDIYAQQNSWKTLSIDKTSTLNIDIADSSGTPIANTAVHIDGSKEKYFNPETLKYSADLTTDSAGHITLTDMEFDNYSVAVSGYTILASSPYQPLDLKADTVLNAKITVGSESYPQIISCEPLIGLIGDSSASLMVRGNNLQGSSIKLVSESGSEIVGTNITYNGNTVIDANFDLSSATAGFWDIVIENNGNVTKQIDGFEIKSP